MANRLISIPISMSRLAGTVSSIRVAEIVDISIMNITGARQRARHFIHGRLEKSMLVDLLDSNADCFGINYIQYGETGEQLDCMK